MQFSVISPFRINLTTISKLLLSTILASLFVAVTPESFTPAANAVPTAANCSPVYTGSATAVLSGNDCIITFTSNGTWSAPVSVSSYKVLVVGGGGGGGYDAGSGGGGGGYFEGIIGLSSQTNRNFNIAIGAGGRRGVHTPLSGEVSGLGTAGGSSSITFTDSDTNTVSVTATGGAYGIYGTSASCCTTPSANGNVSTSNTSSYVSLESTTVSTNISNSGGAGQNYGFTGNGGNGAGGTSSLTYFTGTFGGGGGGGASLKAGSGTGGAGVNGGGSGGSGTNQNATAFAVAGTANTGGGGGSGTAYGTTGAITLGSVTDYSRNGRPGGSGVVKVRFTISDTSAPTITSVTPASGKLSVTFTPPPEISGQTIVSYKYSINGGATWISTGAGTSNSFNITTGISNGTLYYVSVVAIYSNGAGTPSKTMEGTPGETCRPETSTANGYNYFGFKNTGPCSYQIPAGITNVSLLVVGGGGGGGGVAWAGGGGAGGVVYSGNYVTTPGSSLPVFVGTGGAGGINYAPSSVGSNGQNSYFGSSLIAKGGGGGGGYGWQYNYSYAQGAAGGSGGGIGETGRNTSGGISNQSAISGAVVYGNSGGNLNYASGSQAGTGGGGAGGAGTAVSAFRAPGKGGIGISTYSTMLQAVSAGEESITVTSGGSTITRWIAGGGGGGSITGAAGGKGGGGAGGSGTAGVNGMANTGGGGGGAHGGSGVGGTGGSGVVVLRYGTPYSYSYAPNGGSGTPRGGGLTFGGQLITTETTTFFTRPNFTLSSWNTTETGTGKSFTVGAVNEMPASDKDLVLYAQWTKTSYAITFNGNGGTPDTPTVAWVPFDGNYVIPNFSGTNKSGSSFESWNTQANGTGTKYLPGSLYNTRSPLTLYAIWSCGSTTISGDTRTVTFLDSCSSWTVPAGVSAIDAVIVGGGGGAGFGYLGGGGGAGSILQSNSSISVTGGVTTIQVTVGAGGAGGFNTVQGNWTKGVNGSPSSIAISGGETFTANGGGYGGGSDTQTGNMGGSGGGGSGTNSQNGGTKDTSSVTGFTLYANNGAKGNNHGGGGGGAGGAGSSTGLGGIGLTIWGVKLAGGGGGWPNANGSDGGGNALSGYTTALNSGTVGASGTGSGGGGGQAGGSGRVMLRYSIAPSYSYSYDLNGGSGVTPLGGISNSGSPFTTASGSGISKTGYVLTGWNTVRSGGDTSTSFALNSNAKNFPTTSSNVTFYAQWSPANANLTVSYNLNYGSSTETLTATSYFAGDTVTVTSTAPTKSGYNFGGWSSGNGIYSSGDKFKIGSSSVVLNAIWNVTNSSWFDVIFNRGTAPETITVPTDTATVGVREVPLSWAPSDLTYSESSIIYKFAGWKSSYDTQTYNVGSNFVMPAQAIEFTAQWKQQLDVTYFFNGGLFGGQKSLKATECNRNPDNMCSDPDSVNISGIVPLRTGYTFNGWLDKDGNSLTLTGDTWTVSAANYLAYASWTPLSSSYPVNYELAGGVAGASETPKAEGEVFDLAGPQTKSGYKFAGWLIGSTTFEPGASYQMGAETLTVTAQWTRNKYFITYSDDPDFGSSDIPADDETTDGYFTVADQPTNSSKVFLFWQTDGGTELEIGENHLVASEDIDGPNLDGARIVLTANWKDALTTYAVTYSIGGGSGTIPTEGRHSSGQVFRAASQGDITRPGYTFSGWTDGTNNFDEGDDITMSNRSKTLTAIWVPVKKAVTFVIDDSSGDSSVQSLDYGSDAIALAPTPIKSGFTLRGWATSLESSPVDSFQVSDEVTLYAIWAVESTNSTSNARPRRDIDPNTSNTNNSGSGSGSNGSNGGGGTPTNPASTPSNPITNYGSGRQQIQPTAGSAVTLVNGMLIKSTLTPVDGNALTLTTKLPNGTSGPVVLKIQTTRTDGSINNLASNSSLIITPGGKSSVSGSGFFRNTVVKAWLFSKPKFLGDIQVDANGEFNQELLVPKNLPVGKHTIQLNGVAYTGKTISASMLVVVKAKKVKKPVKQVVTGTKKQAVVPFEYKSFEVDSAGLDAIGTLDLSTAKVVTIYGYAANDKSNDDMRVSLFRAIEVKKALEKQYPNIKFNTVAKGSKKTSACADLKNLCAIVVVTK